MNEKPPFGCFVTVVLIFLYFSLAGPPLAPQAVQAAENVVTEIEVGKNIRDFGENVYLFKRVGVHFGAALAAFLKANPSLEVSSVSPNMVEKNRLIGELEESFRDKKTDLASYYSAPDGYWVTCRVKAQYLR